MNSIKITQTEFIKGIKQCMNFIMRKKDTKETIYSIRDNCSDLSSFTNFIFIIGTIFGLLWLLYSIWLIFLPASGFDNAIKHINNEQFNSAYCISFFPIKLLPVYIEIKSVIYPKLFSIASNFTVLLGYGLLMVIIYFIKEILNSIRYNHTPFTIVNANRLKYIGIFTILKTILPNTLAFIYINKAITCGNCNFFTGFSFIFIGMLVLVLSRIFKYGCQLQEDIDETL